MAHYLVRARPKLDRLPELAERLASDEIEVMRPFGRALNHSLRQARSISPEQAIWEEEDYCRPPLAQERAAVLDAYFEEIRVEPVAPGEGWQQIEDLPSLWQDIESSDPSGS